MNRSKKLIINSIIFMIGSFGSKLIGFLMIPLYTHTMIPDDFGQVDLIITTVNLFIPIATLTLGQAVIRFVIEASGDIKKINAIYSNAVFINILCLLIMFLCYPIFLYFDVFGSYLSFFIILLILSALSDTLAQYCRVIGSVKSYAINGIILSIVLASLNILFLVYFHWGIRGYMLSNIIANLFSVIYLFVVIKGYKRFSMKLINKTLIYSLIKFSVPIIPNSLMWWIITSSSRYFILFFIGVTGNGLFAVASKIPSIILMMTSTFSQAWQISAFEEYESHDRSEFFSKIFKFYYFALFLCGSVVLIVLKPVVSNFLEQSYSNCWRLVPALIYGVVYQSLGAFIGTTYTAAKSTKSVLFSSLPGGIAAVFLSIILLPTIGLNGAGISMAIGFFLMWLIRMIDSKKFVEVKLNKLNFFAINILLFIQSLLLFSINNNVLLVIFEIACFILMLLVGKKMLNELIKTFTKKISSFSK